MSTNQEWIDAIYKKLQENNEPHLVAYADVSKAFPARPHQNYFEINAIDFYALTTWANGVGYEAKADPESTHPDQQTIPWIRFTKK